MRINISLPRAAGLCARGLLLLALTLVLTAGTEVSGPMLQVAERPEQGTYVVDGEGMSLYLFLPDEGASSTCYEDCAKAWPPLLLNDPQASVNAGEGIDEELLGSTERTDGSQQVTYNGWPLYYFVQDEEPGHVNGQGLRESWYLVTPDGTPSGVSAAAESEEDLLAGLMTEGEGVYLRNCAGCHGEQGDEARATHVEILADNDRAVKVGSRVIRQVVFGGSYMPKFGEQLTDRQVAAVVTYIRNSWGNDFELVTEEEVTQVREQFQ